VEDLSNVRRLIQPVGGKFSWYWYIPGDPVDYIRGGDCFSNCLLEQEEAKIIEPVSGFERDDMPLFELVVDSVLS